MALMEWVEGGLMGISLKEGTCAHEDGVIERERMRDNINYQSKNYVKPKDLWIPSPTMLLYVFSYLIRKGAKVHNTRFCIILTSSKP
ncbi:hypothetical protein RIF29_17827 [Crotalaria pallida]|uniref:Uncharacterized protein n=1 Tax=Crotalaria pallida TaxID=3830 RepID=A0AAN9IDB6_CROPI